MKREHILSRIFIFCLFIAIVVVMFLVNAEIDKKFTFYLGIYGSVMVSYLLIKMSLAIFYKPYTNPPIKAKVAAIIPYFNESIDVMKATVNSLLQQTYPIYEIYVIDDGSSDSKVFDELKKWIEKKEENFNVIFHRLNENKGKRHAQSYAFNKSEADFFLTVDSDGHLFKDALFELMRPFVDHTVMSVTGHVNARNKNRNLLTKLLDMRYDNAFRIERASQSITGNILVCSGPISCHRAKIVKENLDHYTTQTFLGTPVQYGDDRCLTNYGIRSGKTIYQSTAKCETDVPDNLFGFFKQQVRWTKSFFRESLICIKIGFSKYRVLPWAFAEMFLWILFALVILYTVIFHFSSINGWTLIYYMTFVILSAYARNVFYLLKHPLIFLLAPLYGFLHLFLLLPLKFYALGTLKSTKWGTR